MLHGFHAVRVLLERAPLRVLRVWVAATRDDARVAQILELARKSDRPVERVERARLEAIAGNAVHQGLVAEVRPLPTWTEDDLMSALGSVRAPLLLVLDGVQDPHNLGACLRTADACGALAIIVPKDRSAPLNATARKVAAGAAEFTPTVLVTNLARCLRDLKSAGIWVIGADAAADRAIAAVDLQGGVAIVLGSEGAGLRHLTRQVCDLTVRLPMQGSVESLNVSVAAGMLLYEAVRQRG